MSIDPRSDKVALYYTGDGRAHSLEGGIGVPARDLTENDIARLQYKQQLLAHPDKAPTPLSGAAGSASIDKLMDRLTEGPFRKTNPAASPADKPKE